MAKKPSDNFLRALCAQLRAALDDGGELGYEFAELVDEALDLIAGPEGDDELGDSGPGVDSEADDFAGGHDEGDEEGVLRDEPDMGHRVQRLGRETERMDQPLGRAARPLAGAASGDARRAPLNGSVCERSGRGRR